MAVALDLFAASVKLNAALALLKLPSPPVLSPSRIWYPARVP
jgi:hypothetical protein